MTHQFFKFFIKISIKKKKLRIKKKKNHIKVKSKANRKRNLSLSLGRCLYIYILSTLDPSFFLFGCSNMRSLHRGKNSLIHVFVYEIVLAYFDYNFSFFIGCLLLGFFLFLFFFFLCVWILALTFVYKTNAIFLYKNK